MNKIFETHAHYEDESFNEDREAVIASLFQNNIGWVVNVGASMDTCRKTVELVKRYDNFYGALGVHPSEVAELTEDDMKWLECTINSTDKIVAVGEVGFDYHWPEPTRELQAKWFERQLELVAAVKKPVIIHSREADADTKDILKAHNNEFYGGIIHCYSYSKESARDYLNMGYHIGVGGVVTFKNGKRLKETVEYMPLDRLVLETDCPYMAPEPYRGRRNNSLYLSYVVAEIARIKGITEEEVIKITRDNASKLFGIGV